MRGLILALFALSSPAMATDISGITPGMSRDQAYAVLSQMGTVTTGSSSGTAVFYVNGGLTNVSMCHDGVTVSSVTRNFDSGFPGFVRAAQTAEAQRGKGVFTVDGHEGSPSVYTLQEKWVDATRQEYSVFYGEYGNGNRSSESLSRRC